MYKLFNWKQEFLGNFTTIDQARQALKGINGNGYLEYTTETIELYRAVDSVFKSCKKVTGGKKLPVARPLA